MSEESPRVDRDGIYIERDLADRIAIEEELDSNITSEYHFPSPQRRRIAAWVYLLAGAGTVFAFPEGWAVAIGFGVIAAWHFLSSWPLQIDEHEAMTRAASVVDFAVGHASASVRFKGWRSRPRWSVVMYSATEPPDRRALVVVDASTGDVVEPPYTEDVTTV
ncbi:MAG TPA: hypothetical protein VJ948_02955 [Acidimicrobiia bacterium]|nr:hypothetical protein [Acidimicrobiia bacterium]